jgi:2,4-dienoyl-CoA reductase-like NADH-dependent reductase (Old Yellow Enzyme family)
VSADGRIFTDNPDAQANRKRKALAIADELTRRGYTADTLDWWALSQGDEADLAPERRAVERAANVSRSSAATWALAVGMLRTREHVERLAAGCGLVAIPRASGTGAAALERVRQVVGEGYDAANDDTQTDEQLARAGACYALPWLCRPGGGFAQAAAHRGTR